MSVEEEARIKLFPPDVSMFLSSQVKRVVPVIQGIREASFPKMLSASKNAGLRKAMSFHFLIEESLQ